jgi:hypothetical protein
VDLPALVAEVALELAADGGLGVGGEAVADLGVEPADGLEQPQVADLHEVIGGLRAGPVPVHARPHQ